MLPRVGGEIVFKARGINDMDEFNRLCPEPQPPTLLTGDGKKKTDDKDKDYLAECEEYGRRKWGYIVVKSLEPSNIEWDTVKLEVPSTWANWDSELRANGITSVECNRVFSLALAANSLDERKLNKAREVFLRGRPAE